MISEPRPGPWVPIPVGANVMGAAPDDKFATNTERPVHRVEFRRAFLLAPFPVTVDQYRAFRPGHTAAADPALPVTEVSCDDARDYCAWLRAETGEPVRLPSEAEWEYACRAGATAPFATGAELRPDQANYLFAEDGERVGPGRRTPAGRYPPNAFGLEDLHGNVCEWVADGWHPDYAGAPTDGTAWREGGDPGRGVIRGGAWDYLPRLLRCAWRDGPPRGCRRDNLGFRLARDPAP